MFDVSWNDYYSTYQSILIDHVKLVRRGLGSSDNRDVNDDLEKAMEAFAFCTCYIHSLPKKKITHCQDPTKLPLTHRGTLCGP